MYRFESRVTADGVESILRKLQMEWHRCCLMENVQERLEELKIRNCMMDVLQYHM